MPNIKIDPDIEPYARYQSVINILLTTEAELARREGRSYESASELLARIKLEPQTGKTLTLGHSRRVQKRQTK